MAWPARSRTARRAELRPVAGAALAALVISGCGINDGAAEAPGGGPDARSDAVIDISGSAPVGESIGGSVAPLVECRDWNGANEEQRLATIEAVRAQQNPEDPGITAPALTDEEAGELFDNACEPSFAQGFRLYKLYAQAAGFLPLKRALDE